MIKQLLQPFGSSASTAAEPLVMTESFAHLLTNIDSKRQQRSEEHIINKKYYDYYETAKATNTGIAVVHFPGAPDVEVDHWEIFRPAAFNATIAGEREHYALGTKDDPTSRQQYKVSITSEHSFKAGTAKRFYIQCNCLDFQIVFSKSDQTAGYCLPNNIAPEGVASEEAIQAQEAGIGICKHAYCIMKHPRYAEFLGNAADTSALISKLPTYEEPEPEEEMPIVSPSLITPPTIPAPPTTIPPEPLLKQRAREHIKKSLTQTIASITASYDIADRDVYIRYSGSKTQYKKYLFTVTLVNLDKTYLKFPPPTYNGKINVVSYSSQKLESRFRSTVKLPPMTYNNKQYTTLDIYAIFSPAELIDIIRSLGESVKMPNELEQELTTANIPITESIFEDLTLETISFNFLIEDLIRDYNDYSNN